MLPTSGFTIENIDKTKAIIFFGRNTTGPDNNIHIIDVHLIKNAVVS